MIEERCIDGTEIIENKCVSKYLKEKGTVLASEVCDETFMHYENGTWICKQSVHFRSDELPDTRYVSLKSMLHTPSLISKRRYVESDIRA